MPQTPTIASLMTEITATADFTQSLWEARLTMEQKGIRHLPVVQGERVVGMLSDRDVKQAGVVEKNEVPVTVGDICAKDIFTVAVDGNLCDTLRTMAERGLGSVVVCDKGKPIGIITTTDVCRGFSELLNCQ